MKNKVKKSVTIINVFIILGLIFLLSILVYLIGLNATLKFDKSRLELTNIKLDVCDINGEIINKNESKSIALNELNDYTVSAFLSIEDKDFYKHKGVNYKRILGAMASNIKSKSFNQGASTISQQLIKNTHLTNEKTIDRKIKEILITRKMEKQMPKDKILETYLNVIYFGESAFGIEQASQVYFSKSASDLSISESAMLAGIIKSPAQYSPIYNIENCVSRRNLVLKEMHEDYLITTEEYNSAIKEDLILNINLESKSNYENLYLKETYNEAMNILGITEKELGINGIKIYTYQDNSKQKILEKLISDDEYYMSNEYGNNPDSIGVIINNSTGGIEAYYGKSKYDLVGLCRQPGSAIKPILVYSPALEYGYISPITPINDEEINIDGYSPQNLGNVYHGYVSAKEAVADSLNIPAVKLMNYVGIDKCKEFAKKSNIAFDTNDNGYAIALGGFTNGIRLIDLTNSFLPYSNNGKIVDAKFIKKIVDNKGNVLYQNNEDKRNVMSEDTAYLMHDMLKDGVNNGTSRALKNLPYEVAGKTGTVCVKNSNYNTDAISVAYTSSHTMGVWYGNTSYHDEYKLVSKVNGGTYPTYIIRDTFKEMYTESPNPIPMPDSVEEVEIDINELNNNHKVVLASKYCPDRYKLKTIVSKRYMPVSGIDNYKDFDIANFYVNLIDDKVEITFDAIDYIDYKIVRKCGNNEMVLASYKDKSGQIKYIDTKIEKDTTYRYKIVAEYKILHSTRQTEEITIITPKYEKKYVEQLDKINSNINTKNNDWLFSINQ